MYQTGPAISVPPMVNQRKGLKGPALEACRWGFPAHPRLIPNPGLRILRGGQSCGTSRGVGRPPTTLHHLETIADDVIEAGASILVIGN
jgi:hypothetical protein